MAEFQKVTEEAKRMCWHYTQRGSHAGCPMYPACNVSQCRKIAFERPAEFEGRVMSWAAEHPEPVYPSIAKYLERFGIIIRRDGSLEADFFKANEPMSAYMANLLGISPEEGENEKAD